MPERFQLSRAKGWRMPAGGIRCDRTTPWGNPYRVVKDTIGWWCMLDRQNGLLFLSDGLLFASERETRAQAILMHRELIDRDAALLAAARDALSGHDLGCWCGLNEACHVDTWLQLVNTPIAGGAAIERCACQAGGTCRWPDCEKTGKGLGHYP